MPVTRAGIGRWALAGLLVLASSGCTRDRSEETPPSPTPHAASTAVPAPTTHDNIVATRRYSAWLLHAVPMPPGAKEWRRSPTAHYRNGSLGIGPSDPKLSRVTWWTVALSRDAFGTWLHHHVPRGLRVEDSGGGVESEGVWEDDVDFRAPSTRAHTRAWVNFAFMAYGDGLVVRVDTFVGARFARTVLVPTDTTAVTIRRTQRSFTGHRRSHTTVRRVTDSRDVADLVAMLDGLPGSMTTPFVASCPAMLDERSYSMTFTGPRGTYVASLPTASCWGQLTLARNGVDVGPSLDPGQRFVRVADRFLS
jgi:hypothetical protein